MRIIEFLGFTTPTTAAAAATTSKQPWQMTRNEVRNLPHDMLDKMFWKPAVDHIQREAGSRDPERVIAFYCRKYKLPPVGFEWSNRLPPNVNGEAVGQGDQWRILLSPRLKGSPNEMMIVLRHEIEHVIDHVRNHFHVTQDRAHEHPDHAGGMNVDAGHHKFFPEFNTDYAHRVVVRDALHRGQDVPAEVLKDYPGLH